MSGLLSEFRCHASVIIYLYITTNNFVLVIRFIKICSSTQFKLNMKVLIVFSLVYIIENAHSLLEKELTVFIHPESENCFYQYAKQGESIEIEYQVIDGGHGSLDVTFRLVDPDGRIILTDLKKPENNHKHDAQITGDFRFCFDNSYNSYNTKTVFFEIMIYRDDEDGWASDEKYDFNTIGDNQNYGEIGMENLQEIVNTIHDHLTKVRSLQELIKSTEARDRNVAEENFLRVNECSMLQLGLMISVGMVQVLVLRALFDDSSRVHHLWKKMDQGLFSSS